MPEYAIGDQTAQGWSACCATVRGPHSLWIVVMTAGKNRGKLDWRLWMRRSFEARFGCDTGALVVEFPIRSLLGQRERRAPHHANHQRDRLSLGR